LDVAKASDVFISYSRADRAFVDRLVADLRDHHIDVWLDTLELVVGDQFRHRVEEGIEGSRYFCIVISPAAMSSFFVRRFELEPALTRMIAERRIGYVLPLLLKKPRRALPAMLRTLQYLDFSDMRTYLDNLQRLVRRLRLDSESFCGSRLYKNVDTALTGTMVGVGPLKQLPHHGAAVRVHYTDGRIVSMETYTDGKPDGAKSVIYDQHKRVSEIVLFRKDQVVDTWYYVYSRTTGKRKYKLISRPGARPHLRIEYDAAGYKITEAYLAADGTPDAARRFCTVKYTYNKDGSLSSTRYLNAGGGPVSPPAP
jgi:hypothetical protein